MIRSIVILQFILLGLIIYVGYLFLWLLFELAPLECEKEKTEKKSKE